MNKIKEMKLIIENWNSYNKDIISERVFYGSGDKFVTTTSDYMKDIPEDKKPILIYDDYTVLLNQKPKQGFDIGLKCLSKDFVSKSVDPDDESITYMIDLIEDAFGDLNQEQFDIVKSRFKIYKDKHGENMFKDDRFIIFNPYASFKTDHISISQEPIVKDDAPEEVDYEIPAKELSGKDTFEMKKSDFPDSYSPTDPDFEKVIKYKINTLKSNINWSIHDFGHNIFEGAFTEESSIDFMEGEELRNSKIFKKIYPDTFKGERNLDRIYKLFKKDNKDNDRDLLDITKLVDELTPGVGAFDSEYSFFADLLKSSDNDKAFKMVEKIVKFVEDNKEEVKKSIIDHFDLDNTTDNFREFLLDIFKKQITVSNNFMKHIKIILVS
tara:strand:+ start:3070 stop:4215 length:1146 start_codon:yes stop_codon:yes gene_type:complete